MAMSRGGRREVVDDPVADLERALGGVLEACQHAQRRALPAARRPDQHEELAVCSLQREIVDRDRVAEALGDVLEDDLGH
jgi:hypothetical protein